MTVVDAQNMYNTYIYKSVQTHQTNLPAFSYRCPGALSQNLKSDIYNIYNGRMNTKIDI